MKSPESECNIPSFLAMGSPIGTVGGKQVYPGKRRGEGEKMTIFLTHRRLSGFFSFSFLCYHTPIHTSTSS